MVADDVSTFKNFSYFFEYADVIPKKLPYHSFHVIHSKDVANTCLSIMKLENPKNIYTIGLPKTSINKFMENNNVFFEGILPLYFYINN